MSETEKPSKLEYLQAERRYFEKEEMDPDLKTMFLYELDQEIKEERRKVKPE